jgi:hypothetical protein
VKTRVPTTFTGRKRWEMEAWRLTRDAFERHGFQVAPLGLNRSLILPQAEPLILSAPSPPTALMLLCAPDAIAFHKPTQRAYLLELKATYRETFALRARDFTGLLMWQSLLCVVHLPSERVYVCPIDDLPPPNASSCPLPADPFPVGMQVASSSCGVAFPKPLSCKARKCPQAAKRPSASGDFPT